MGWLGWQVTAFAAKAGSYRDGCGPLCHVGAGLGREGDDTVQAVAITAYTCNTSSARPPTSWITK